MGKVAKIARRTFLLGAAVVGTGAAIGYYYYQREPNNPIEDMLADGEATFNPFLKIGADNSITVYTGRAEMGQGSSTTLAAMVAEELDVEMDQITVEHGPFSSAYRNNAVLAEGGKSRPWDDSFGARMEHNVFGALGEILGVQATGGSTAIVDGFTKMRAAGCAAREVLVAAAAERLGVAKGSLKTEAGHVIAGERRIPYGDLAVAAAQMTPPSDMKLRAEKDWRLLGKAQRRLDLLPKVTGAPIFGVDVELPDMVHATVRMSPRFGGGINRYDDSAALNVPGVEKVIRIDTHDAHGFGVIASNTWAAFKGAAAIEVEWGDAPYPGSVEEIMADYERVLESVDGSAFRSEGDAAGALASAPSGEVIEADYRAQFLAHACMEPMNATAQFKDGKLKLWAPNQSPTVMAMAGAAAVGIDRADVEVVTTHLGGGFGRRGEPDFPRYAAILSKHTNGRPVKVTWTREEDQTHDVYRPAAIGRFRAHAKQGAAPGAFYAKISSPSIQQSLMSRILFTPPSPTPDKVAVDGVFNQPYDFENVQVEAVHPDQTLPIGFWRSVGNSYCGFFNEGFMDEIAVATGQDPVEMRLKLMENYPAPKKTLEKVAEMAGWGRNPGPNRGLGVAFTYSFGSSCAQVMEVTATDEGIRMDKVWCAVDVGKAMDPDMVAKQMSSGVIYGLSSAMNQNITLVDGEVQELNFWDYDAMRMAQCPEIEVAVLENAPKMGGAGEPGTPPSIPALGNAIYAATGKRLRSLPFGGEIDFV